MSPRDVNRTRAALLEAAFEEMWRVGFQAASLDDIPAAAGVTKGALYYHFKNKSELGQAVIREMIAGGVLHLEEALQAGPDPITALQRFVANQPEEWGDKALLGCPMNNIAQEMSSLDEGLRSEIVQLYARWEGAVSEALRRGIEAGTIREDVDPDDTALFIVGAMEGAMGLTKSHGDTKVLDRVAKSFVGYLELLRAAPVVRSEQVSETVTA